MKQNIQSHIIDDCKLYLIRKQAYMKTKHEHSYWRHQRYFELTRQLIIRRTRKSFRRNYSRNRRNYFRNTEIAMRCHVTQRNTKKAKDVDKEKKKGAAPYKPLYAARMNGYEVYRSVYE